MKLRMAGVSRQAEYSPNHVENDSLILRATAEVLKEFDVDVNFYGEGEVLNSNFNEDLIFSMAQGPEAIEKLLEVEKRGALIINSPRAVKNCYRTNMVKLLPENGIPFPKSTQVEINSDIDIDLTGFDPYKFWIKRGDVHAVHREDVTLVYSKEENKSTMKEFYRRGIRTAIIQEHLEGDVIKFYSVRDSGFFNWYYLNGKYHTKFDLNKLTELASNSAEILGLDVYGGDAIVSPGGSISIIDMNDWPSFAPVRDEAKKHIANLIYKMAVKYADN